jgi:FkbM family methyltransferase
MIARLAQFANDCYHVWKAPTGSRSALLRGLVLPGQSKMGFQVAHFDRRTLNYLYREIFVRQYYYFRARNESPVILDCGANVGMASLYFKWLYPKSRVRAFEPDPTTFQLLQQNLNKNHLDVEAYNCALWDEDGVLQFYVDSTNPGSLVMSANAFRSKAEPIKVMARRLSEFIDSPIDFLKLDVEGAEHRVLGDLVQAGKLKHIRQMVVEYHQEQKSCLAGFLQELETAGFEYQIHASRYPVTSQSVFQDMLIEAHQQTIK